MATTKTPAQRTAATATGQALLTVNLSLTKETKGAFRYDAPQNEADRIGGPLNIYFRKDSLKGSAPQNITVTVSVMA